MGVNRFAQPAEVQYQNLFAPLPLDWMYQELQAKQSEYDKGLASIMAMNKPETEQGLRYVEYPGQYLDVYEKGQGKIDQYNIELNKRTNDLMAMWERSGGMTPEFMNKLKEVNTWNMTQLPSVKQATEDKKIYDAMMKNVQEKGYESEWMLNPIYQQNLAYATNPELTMQQTGMLKYYDYDKQFTEELKNMIPDSYERIGVSMPYISKTSREYITADRVINTLKASMESNPGAKKAIQEEYNYLLMSNPNYKDYTRLVPKTYKTDKDGKLIEEDGKPVVDKWETLTGPDAYVHEKFESMARKNVGLYAHEKTGEDIRYYDTSGADRLAWEMEEKKRQTIPDLPFDKNLGISKDIYNTSDYKINDKGEFIGTKSTLLSVYRSLGYISGIPDVVIRTLDEYIGGGKMKQAEEYYKKNEKVIMNAMNQKATDLRKTQPDMFVIKTGTTTRPMTNAETLETYTNSLNNYSKRSGQIVIMSEAERDAISGVYGAGLMNNAVVYQYNEGKLEMVEPKDYIKKGLVDPKLKDKFDPAKLYGYTLSPGDKAGVSPDQNVLFKSVVGENTFYIQTPSQMNSMFADALKIQQLTEESIKNNGKSTEGMVEQTGVGTYMKPVVTAKLVGTKDLPDWQETVNYYETDKDGKIINNEPLPVFFNDLSGYYKDGTLNDILQMTEKAYSTGKFEYTKDYGVTGKRVVTESAGQ